MEEKPSTLSAISSSASINRPSRTIGRDDFTLRYIPEDDGTRSKRPIIPSTRFERLAYFRGVTSTPAKVQVMCSYIYFNRYFWYYVFNVFLKSLPHTYVYLVLASYAPDKSFFLPKMVPILSGFIVASIVTAFLDIVCYSDIVIFCLDFFVNGLVYKNPWYRCPATNNKSPEVNCYTIQDFIKKFEKEESYFNYSYYTTSTGERFQVAPIMYKFHRYDALEAPTEYGSVNLWYFIVIWVIIGLHYRLLFHTYIWKILHGTQIFLMIIYGAIFFHLSFVIFPVKVKESINITMTAKQEAFWEGDYDLVAESMVAPPVVHMLSARSDQEIQPTRDSAMIVASNAIYYIFRGLLTYKVRNYCDSLINYPIISVLYSPNDNFYLFPVYFSQFYLGEIYNDVFFFINFVIEFYLLLVTFHCLVEAIVCEWKLKRREPVVVTIVLCGILWFKFSSFNSRMFVHLITKCLISVIEIFGIYLFYPLGRLVADIKFYNGQTLSKLRYVLIGQVPWYYAGKSFTMIRTFYQVAKDVGFNAFFGYLYWSISIVCVPMLCGMIFGAFYYMCIKKKSWSSLFRPDDSWGPDSYIRELRKQYKSRDYVGSQAPRDLSRYLIRRAESKVYKIDIPYGIHKMSYDLWMESEKKTV